MATTAASTTRTAATATSCHRQRRRLQGAPRLDDICATTNSGPDEENDNITTQWLTVGRDARRRPHRRAAGLLRGWDQPHRGVRGHGAVPSCFNTFIADTRSSTVADRDAVRLRARSARRMRDDAHDDGGRHGERQHRDRHGLVRHRYRDPDHHGTPTWGGTLTCYLCGPVDDRTAATTPASSSRARTVSQALSCHGLCLRDGNIDLGRSLLLDGPFRAERGHRGGRRRSRGR